MQTPSSLVLVLATALAAVPATPRPVVQVGQERLGMDEFRARLAAVPAFQQRAWGRTPREVANTFVERVLVPDLLLGAEIERRKLAELPKVRPLVNEVLRRALESELESEALREHPVNRTEIEQYFAAHAAEFRTPAKILIWRILTDDLERAQKVIREASNAPDTSRWGALFEQASSSEGREPARGDLGFVRADGSTEREEVRVEPALYQAALGLADGELRREPMALGSKYAVVWRRGSVASTERTLDEAAPSIRRLLERERLDAVRRALLEKLGKEHVLELDETLLEAIPETLLTLKAPRVGIVGRSRR